MTRRGKKRDSLPVLGGQSLSDLALKKEPGKKQFQSATGVLHGFLMLIGSWGFSGFFFKISFGFSAFFGFSSFL